MQTVGEVRVIGDSGALQTASRRQFRSASGLVFCLKSFRLDSASMAYTGRAWVEVGGWVGWIGGWPPYLQRVMAIRHKNLRLPLANQTGDAVANPIL